MFLGRPQSKYGLTSVLHNLLLDVFTWNPHNELLQSKFAKQECLLRDWTVKATTVKATTKIPTVKASIKCPPVLFSGRQK